MTLEELTEGEAEPRVKRTREMKPHGLGSAGQFCPIWAAGPGVSLIWLHLEAGPPALAVSLGIRTVLSELSFSHRKWSAFSAESHS